MSWRKEERRAERGYHHGNLKEALLQAALNLIAQKGAAGFTFADAARMAGVSPAAMRMALHIWSMAHGVASLFGRGDAARRKLPMSPEDLLEAEVLIYLRGLGFQTDRRPEAANADPKSSGPPPVPPAGPPSGPWGTPK